MVFNNNRWWDDFSILPMSCSKFTATMRVRSLSGPQQHTGIGAAIQHSNYIAIVFSDNFFNGLMLQVNMVSVALSIWVH